MNIFDKQRWAIYSELMQIGLEQEECWAEADLILEHVTGIKRTQQIISDLDHFKADWLQEITRVLDSRRQRRPLAYCLGEVEFAGLSFRIVPGVLIPRVDTEALVQTIIDRVPNIPLQIAEIGVGSGAIAVTLLKRLPQCHVWACDISELAVTTTLGNARRHDVHERLTLEHGDWKKVLPKDLNIIVSNPPYLPLSLHKETPSKLQPELAFEPKLALFDDSTDGLNFYRQFAQQLPSHFAVGAKGNELASFAAFEIGDTQGQAVSEIFKQFGWQDLQIILDTNNLSRALIASPSPPRG